MAKIEKSKKTIVKGKAEPKKKLGKGVIEKTPYKPSYKILELDPGDKAINEMAGADKIIGSVNVSHLTPNDKTDKIILVVKG